MMMTSELEPETFVASVFLSQRRTGKPSSRANDRWAGLERAGRCDPGVCAFSCPQQCGYAKALGCAASAFTLGRPILRELACSVGEAKPLDPIVASWDVQRESSYLSGVRLW